VKKEPVDGEEPVKVKDEPVEDTLLDIFRDVVKKYSDEM